MAGAACEERRLRPEEKPRTSGSMGRPDNIEHGVSVVRVTSWDGGRAAVGYCEPALHSWRLESATGCRIVTKV